MIVLVHETRTVVCEWALLWGIGFTHPLASSKGGGLLDMYRMRKTFRCFLIRVRVMVFNATFNNISVISWRSVLSVEEIKVPWENHWPVVSHWQTYRIMFYRVHLVWAGFKFTTSVVIGTDCKGSCKSNYHTITTTTAPVSWWYIGSINCFCLFIFSIS